MRKEFTLGFFLIVFATTNVFAGGIGIDRNSITFNGYKCGAYFSRGANVIMQYNANDYSFSGGRYEYFVFKFARKRIRIIEPVGRNGANKPEDVTRIQRALSVLGFDCLIDKAGKDFSSLISAIERFQSKNKLPVTGVIGPYDYGLDCLGSPIYFLQLVSDHVSRNTRTVSFELLVHLPDQDGEFELSCHSIPLFSPIALGTRGEKYSINLDPSANERIVQLVKTYKAFEELCVINIGQSAGPQPELFLTLNGKVPGQTKLALGNSPAKFSWYTTGLPKDAVSVFRFRLYPTEDWSFWEAAKSTDYYIIDKGAHEFQVECMYTSKGQKVLTNQARFSFSLDQSFLSAPNAPLLRSTDVKFIDKGDIVRTAKVGEDIVGKVYDKSRALVLGIDSYDDRTWVRLPYINNDLAAVKDAFLKSGFTVINPPAKKRAEIMEEIRKAIVSSGKNDRLIIYISSHGFLDQISAKPLIACKDCLIKNPSNCISVTELKDLLKGAEDKIRHILLVLDCCTSGVGVMDKSASLGGMKSLATQKGVHVLTAGTAEQNAKMDESKKMSLFTYFLTRGLKSKDADYTNDGIITLTELLVYVQYNVATATKSEQVPNCGRISGFGEMIFN